MEVLAPGQKTPTDDDSNEFRKSIVDVNSARESRMTNIVKKVGPKTDLIMNPELPSLIDPTQFQLAYGRRAVPKLVRNN